MTIVSVDLKKRFEDVKEELPSKDPRLVELFPMDRIFDGTLLPPSIQNEL